jgi:hypothetical protein
VTYGRLACIRLSRLLKSSQQSFKLDLASVRDLRALVLDARTGFPPCWQRDGRRPLFAQ